MQTLTSVILHGIGKEGRGAGLTHKVQALRRLRPPRRITVSSAHSETHKSLRFNIQGVTSATQSTRKCNHVLEDSSGLFLLWQERDGSCEACRRPKGIHLRRLCS